MISVVNISRRGAAAPNRRRRDHRSRTSAAPIPGWHSVGIWGHR